MLFVDRRFVPTRLLFSAIAFLCVPLSAGWVSSEEVKLLTWNVESGGNDARVIAKQLRELHQTGRYDVYGLCEVDFANARRYAEALGKDYRFIVSKTGRRDRLVLIWNAERLELLGQSEPESFNGIRLNDEQLRHRSPLIGKFRLKANGREFQVVLVHLARGNELLRYQQARGLREWARVQELPPIGIGDFNFDFDFPTSKGNQAYDAFCLERTWKWVKPPQLIDTNWADRNRDGKDDYPHSCLDFTFVAGEAKKWKSHSSVIVRQGDFPDNDETSDHRPVELAIDISEKAEP